MISLSKKKNKVGGEQKDSDRRKQEAMGSTLTMRLVSQDSHAIRHTRGWSQANLHKEQRRNNTLKAGEGEPTTKIVQRWGTRYDRVRTTDEEEITFWI